MLYKQDWSKFSLDKSLGC